MEEARRVAEYDAILRDALRDIENLSEQTHRCAQQQGEIEQTLSGIGEMEKELDATLELLEQQVDGKHVGAVFGFTNISFLTFRHLFAL